MKKSILVIGAVVIIFIIALSAATYAFFTQDKVDFTITLRSAVMTTVGLTVNTESGNLVPQKAQNNDSYAKYSGSNNYTAYKITYNATADITSASIYVTTLNFYRNDIEDTTSKEYQYLAQDGVFEYCFRLYKNTAYNNVDVSNVTIPDNEWVQGTGNSHAITFSSNPFATGDTGTIVFFVRFTSAYTDELVPPSCDGEQIYFTINMDVADAVEP